LAGKVRKVQRIGHEPTSLRVLPKRVHRWETGFRSQLDGKPPMDKVLWTRRNGEGIHALLRHDGKSTPIFLILNDASEQGRHKLDADPLRSLLRSFLVDPRPRYTWLKPGDLRSIRDGFF
jgi:hypothetical protein